MYVIQIILSYVAKLILFLLGWKHMKEKQRLQYHKYKRSVIVFSHTSYADFYMYLLYSLAFPKEFKNVKVLVKPQPFVYAGFILRRFGCIPSGPHAIKNSGSTRYIIEELDKQKEFIFLISPKGTIVKSEWRSGYYNIALNLECHLLATGLDYEKKKLVISEGIKYDQKQDDIEIFLKGQLSRIVPLYPEDEIVKIRKHDKNLVSIISPHRLFILILLLISLLLVLWY